MAQGALATAFVPLSSAPWYYALQDLSVIELREVERIVVSSKVRLPRSRNIGYRRLQGNRDANPVHFVI